MLKLLVIGVLGSGAALSGVYGKLFMDQRAQNAEADAGHNSSMTQMKTEMTGVPVIIEGRVLGYVVFQVSSTIDAAKLPSPEFDVGPYLLDAAVRASFQGADDGLLKYNAVYIEHLTEQLRRETNQKLGADAVVAVNIEAFNYVPKEDIRGNLVKMAPTHGQH
jgi:hypothetical protein